MIVIDIEHIARLVDAKRVVVAPKLIHLHELAFDRFSRKAILAEGLDQEFVARNEGSQAVVLGAKVG